MRSGREARGGGAALMSRPWCLSTVSSDMCRDPCVVVCAAPVVALFWIRYGTPTSGASSRRRLSFSSNSPPVSPQERVLRCVGVWWVWVWICVYCDVHGCERSQ